MSDDSRGRTASEVQIDLDGTRPPTTACIVS